MIDQTGPDLGFIHRFVPATSDTAGTLLLLHGTGGNENDLLPLGRTLAPGAALLSPRGRVMEGGMPRFFRRLRPGVFDEDNIVDEASALAQFIHYATKHYRLNLDNLVAVGYSNGANIALSVLLLHPGVLTRAMLLRPMLPLTPAAPPDLSNVALFAAVAERDEMVSQADTTRLLDYLQQRGADMTTYTHAGGHALSQADIEHAQAWLAA